MSVLADSGRQPPFLPPPSCPVQGASVGRPFPGYLLGAGNIRTVPASPRLEVRPSWPLRPRSTRPQLLSSHGELLRSHFPRTPARGEWEEESASSSSSALPELSSPAGESGPFSWRLNSNFHQNCRLWGLRCAGVGVGGWG